MKKLLYLLLLVPLGMVTGCSKDDEVKPFDMTLTLSGVTQDNGNFYTVSGNDVTIESLEVKALDGTSTSVANVVYFLDGMPLVGVPGDFFDGTFSTAGLPVGQHTLGVTGNLLQVGASIQNFAATYTLNIVQSEEDLPSGAPAIGTYSQTFQVKN